MPATSEELQTVTTAQEMRAIVSAARAAGESVGFIPTMGALHAGHLSLVDAARRECDRVAASIFVNPTQFGPAEDFAKYPRPLEHDLKQLAAHGCDWAFVPTADEMYPPGFNSYVDVGDVARTLEGAARPMHFRGVATVVLKLFQCVPADRAYFGRKDYQQTLVVKRLVEDFNLPIEIRVCPIVREADGLAMSSRNAYLSADQRRQAVALSKSLKLAETMYAGGQRNAHDIRQAMLAELAEARIDVDYVAVLADGTMREIDELTGPATVAIAARVGATRLIDNHRLG